MIICFTQGLLEFAPGPFPDDSIDFTPTMIPSEVFLELDFLSSGEFAICLSKAPERSRLIYEEDSNLRQVLGDFFSIHDQAMKK